jgi:hypothetical protein
MLMGKGRIIPLLTPGAVLDRLQEHNDGVLEIVEELRQEIFQIVDNGDYEEIAFPKLVRVLAKWFDEKRLTEEWLNDE